MASEPEQQPPRDSATVIVTRDARGGGIDVFMLERHVASEFAGGAYVFPGGKIDEADCLDELAGHADLPEPADALAARVEASPGCGLGFHLAAIRETFEEAGVLLARHARDGSDVRLVGEGEERWAAVREELIGGRTDLLEIAKREGVRYALDRLSYFMRWVTPEALPHRYDTRFFVAALPEGQVPLHDAVETTQSMWIRPADALARARDGSLQMMFPTKKTLEVLAGFERVADLVASTRGKVVERLLPRVVERDGKHVIELPSKGGVTVHEP